MHKCLIIERMNNENKILNLLKENDCNSYTIIYGRGAYKGLFDFKEHKRSLIFFQCEKISKIKDYVKNQLHFEEGNTGIMITFKGGNMKKNYQLVVTIVSAGFSDEVMNKARECGATGGTIIDGRGTGAKQASFMGMQIDSQKEIVLSVVPDDIANQMVKNITKFIKEDENVSGICFGLPVSEYIGINLDNNKPEKNKG